MNKNVFWKIYIIENFARFGDDTKVLIAWIYQVRCRNQYKQKAKKCVTILNVTSDDVYLIAE